MATPALQKIDAETQIFTPAWVSKFLAQNSIGRLWVNSFPTSGFDDKLGRYVACDNPDGLATVESPEEIRVLDPACGTGNLLVAAFDVLYDMYLHAKYKPVVIPELILTKNLVGYDIDPDAVEAASAILTAKAHEKQSHFFRRRVVPNVRAWAADDHPDAGLYGTLIRSLDSAKYHVILANPPYMGSKHYPREMVKWAKQEFPNSWRDLCAMFIDRGHEMTVPGGMIAMITMESWMFLTSFEVMRRKMLGERTIITMAHLGAGVFGRGAVISTTAFVQASMPTIGYRGTFFRLVDSRHKERDLHEAILGHRMGRSGFDADLAIAWADQKARERA